MGSQCVAGMEGFSEFQCLSVLAQDAGLHAGSLQPS